MTLQLDWLRGCATALVTPFTASGAVDEKRLRDLIEYQIVDPQRLTGHAQWRQTPRVNRLSASATRRRGER